MALKLPTPTRNAQGGKEMSYAVLAEVRASIAQTSQTRALEVAPALIDTDKVIVRASSLTKDITKDWLVNYDNREHVVHAIEFIEKGQFIKLIVKAK